MINWQSILPLMQQGAKGVQGMFGGMPDYLKNLPAPQAGGAPQPQAQPEKTPWLQQQGFGGLQRGELLLAGMGMLGGRNFSEGLANTSGTLYGAMGRQSKEAEERKKREALLKAMTAGGMSPQQAEALAEFDPSIAFGQMNRAQDLEIDTARYNKGEEWKERQWLRDQQRWETDQEWQQRIYDREGKWRDEDAEATRAAQAAATAPRDLWQSAGDGVIFNQRTGQVKGTRGMGGGTPGGTLTPMESIPVNSPFMNENIGMYGPQGYQPVEYTLGNLTQGKPRGFGQEYEDNDDLADYQAFNMAPALRPPSKFDDITDRELAKDLSTWKANGQFNASTQLERLAGAIDALDANPGLTGPHNIALGMFGGQEAGRPSAGRVMMAPEGVALQQEVELVIQNSLKAILGGQFAQAEAEALFARSFDPRLDGTANAKRLKQAYNELLARAMWNDQAAAYADFNGTLQGFNPRLPKLPSWKAGEVYDTGGGGKGKPTSWGGTAPGFKGMVKKPAQQLPQIRGDADFDALPPGSEFIGPDGKRYRKP